jgi:hypothetical protein
MPTAPAVAQAARCAQWVSGDVVVYVPYVSGRPGSSGGALRSRGDKRAAPEAQAEPGEIMNKLKMFAITTLAAATIGVGGLVLSPSASAARYTCDRALALAQAYIVIGDMLYNGGNYSAASYYYGRATGIVDTSC